jgi:hypothetical protein
LSFAGCRAARPKATSVRGHVRHIAAERHDGGALPVDKLLQPTRGASRQIHGAPDARLEQRRRADRAFLGGEKIDQWRGIRFELDDADKDRAVQHDHFGRPVASS